MCVRVRKDKGSSQNPKTTKMALILVTARGPSYPPGSLFPPSPPSFGTFYYASRHREKDLNTYMGFNQASRSDGMAKNTDKSFLLFFFYRYFIFTFSSGIKKKKKTTRRTESKQEASRGKKGKVRKQRGASLARDKLRIALYSF
uniref:Uncharacterized protein n=1 Tax=Trypanosoma vivax (strain Y486) TaxID=1055687 RepID=G0UAK3_TRYVY|nr:hypothetical protein, unlikely [Trypanosoma vivax Y486]